MNRRSFLATGAAATTAVVSAVAVTTSALALRVVNPRWVGTDHREWRSGESIYFAFKYFVFANREGNQRLNVGERIRMDGSAFNGPTFEGVVTEVEDEVVGRSAIQRITGVRT